VVGDAPAVPGAPLQQRKMLHWMCATTAWGQLCWDVELSNTHQPTEAGAAACVCPCSAAQLTIVQLWRRGEKALPASLQIMSWRRWRSRLATPLVSGRDGRAGCCCCCCCLLTACTDGIQETLKMIMMCVRDCRRWAYAGLSCAVTLQVSVAATSQCQASTAWRMPRSCTQHSCPES
jgi:hypothetical protein